jgi:hypothetical protein
MPSICVLIPSPDPDCEINVHLPATWEICPACQGAGQSSAHLGAITQDDWENDWSDDEREDYLGGAYDHICAVCGGSGKVLEPNRQACVTDDHKAALAAYDEDLRNQAEERSCLRMERGDYLSDF